MRTSAVWLSLVAAIALHRVAPAGRIQRLARLWFLASVAVLVTIAVPFARDQVKDALLPAGSGARGGRSRPPETAAWAATSRPRSPRRDPVQPAAPAAESRGRAEEPREGGRLGRAHEGGSHGRKRERGEARLLPTTWPSSRTRRPCCRPGPGVPRWAWRSYSLAWSGAVGRDHTLRLFLLSPGTNRLLTLLRLVLLAVFAYVLLAGRWPTWPVLPRPRRSKPLAALLALLLVPAASPAQQETPERRDPAGAEAAPHARRPLRAALLHDPSLVLRLGDGRLQLGAEVHAAADGTWALPGPVGSWTPAEIRIGGAPAVAVARLAPGFLYLRLPRGVDRIEATGPVLPATASRCSSPTRRAVRAPKRGMGRERPRKAAPRGVDTADAQARRPTAAPRRPRAATPWLEVTRTLRFGVDLDGRDARAPRHARGRASRAARSAAARRGAHRRRSRGREGRGRGEPRRRRERHRLGVDAQSRLPRSCCGRRGAVLWSRGLETPLQTDLGVRCYRTRSRVASRRRRVRPALPPWPGETITVSLAHPAGRRGPDPDDRRRYAQRGHPGPPPRARAPQRNISRSSREQALVLRVPEAAEVQQVTIDGDERPARPEKGELRVTVPAGGHALEVRWQQARGIGDLLRGAAGILSRARRSTSRSS